MLWIFLVVPFGVLFGNLGCKRFLLLLPGLCAICISIDPIDSMIRCSKLLASWLDLLRSSENSALPSFLFSVGLSGFVVCIIINSCSILEDMRLYIICKSSSKLFLWSLSLSSLTVHLVSEKVWVLPTLSRGSRLVGISLKLLFSILLSIEWCDGFWWICRCDARIECGISSSFYIVRFSTEKRHIAIESVIFSCFMILILDVLSKIDIALCISSLSDPLINIVAPIGHIMTQKLLTILLILPISGLHLILTTNKL